MTSNQTIDGVLVSRDLLEQFLAGGRQRDRESLRALLDTPAESVEGLEADNAKLAADRSRLSDELETLRKAYKSVLVQLDAAQTQGESVAWLIQWGSVIPGFQGHREVVLKDPGEIDAVVTPLYAEQPAPFQSRVQPWMLQCFGEAIAADRQERNHRFLEEALELVQANQCTASEAHQLVDYVYSRSVGEPSQEVGGVMVTLAALCLASGLDMHAAAETELARIWTKVDQIRAKQAAKPSMSPLPGVYPDREQPAPVAVVMPERMYSLLPGADYWNACLDEVTRLNTK